MKNRKGFTLIEILVAITLVAILGSVVGLKLVDIPQRGRVSAAKTQIGALKTAVQIYANDNRFPPTQQQGLEALVARASIPPIPENFAPGGYLDSREVPKDPWKRDYAYMAPGRNGEAFEIVCYGADGEEGGDGYNADISSSDN
jgi:general secretion pathway protein G